MIAQLEMNLSGGFCSGPLFAPVVKRRINPRLIMSGGSEVWIKYRRARPPWQAARGLREVWRESMLLTAATGVQQSVDHIVPLIHPFVCGLHCRANLEIVPLSVNIAKSNNSWPDMWAPQSLLF